MVCMIWCSRATIRAGRVEANVGGVVGAGEWPPGDPGDLGDPGAPCDPGAPVAAPVLEAGNIQAPTAERDLAVRGRSRSRISFVVVLRSRSEIWIHEWLVWLVLILMFLVLGVTLVLVLIPRLEWEEPEGSVWLWMLRY
jgi:hypothetical protein